LFLIPCWGKKSIICVCCVPECPEGMFGPGCIQPCNCTECPAGMFGLGCRHRCQCENEALCDHVSGACTCRVGWTGTFCEKRKRSPSIGKPDSPNVTHSKTRFVRNVCVSACPQGFYGLNCQEKCFCQNGGSCDHISGVCSCFAGWIGPSCNFSE
ncbi:hypothetical protein XENOCAPTIV_008386, partial [Xenoophorus captivus]